jgi:hypothetical protein
MGRTKKERRGKEEEEAADDKSSFKTLYKWPHVKRVPRSFKHHRES